MAQIQKKFIATNAVDENKIRLSNNASLKARNAANTADVNIVKLNASDRIEYASVPQVTADAAAGNDLVRYSQVQSLIEGLKPKQAVRVATTAAGVLATDFENLDVIDGVTLATGDRILIKDQTAAAENGIYIVAATGAPTRASDFNAASEIPGSYTVAQQGTTNQGTLFVCLSSPTTLGTDPIQFAARSITTYTGGDMITLTGSAFSVDLHATSGLESSNPGNAAGQLRVKLEAANASLQINGSNQLGVKVDTARGLSSGAAGLGVNLAAAGGLEFAAGATQINVDSTNSTTKINAANELEAVKENVQQITLVAADITNQFVDLSFAARSANSISLTVLGGVMQNRGIDYTILLTGGVGGVTRVTFAGDLASAGAAALVAGDILVVTYEYL